MSINNDYTQVITRDSFFVRGEIIGFAKDELLRKHLQRMFSLIKNKNSSNSSIYMEKLEEGAMKLARDLLSL